MKISQLKSSCPKEKSIENKAPSASINNPQNSCRYFTSKDTIQGQLEPSSTLLQFVHIFQTLSLSKKGPSTILGMAKANSVGSVLSLSNSCLINHVTR